MEFDRRRSTCWGSRIALGNRTDNAKPTPIQATPHYKRQQPDTHTCAVIGCVAMRRTPLILPHRDDVKDTSHFARRRIRTLPVSSPKRWNILIFRGHLPLLSLITSETCEISTRQNRAPRFTPLHGAEPVVNAFYYVTWSPKHWCSGITTRNMRAIIPTHSPLRGLHGTKVQ